MSYGGFEYSNDGGGEGGGGGFGDNNGGFGGDGGSAMGGGFAADTGLSQGGGAQDGKRNRDLETLMPATIKQISGATQDAPDDNFMIDGKEVTQVKIVGCVVEMAVQSTNISYQLEDGTGRIEMKQWINADEGEGDSARRAQISENMYVTAVGTLRAFQDKRTITAYSVQPVTDHNAVTHHFLDCVYVHLQNTKGPLQGTSGASGAAVVGQTFGAPAQQGAAAAGGLGAKQALSAGGGETTNPVQEVVQQCFASAGDDDAGLSMAEVTRMAGEKGIKADEVQKMVAFMAAEGHLYSTIDENHFKSTV